LTGNEVEKEAINGIHKKIAEVKADNLRYRYIDNADAVK